MIIEGAIFKLPKLLIEHDFPKDQYEAFLTNQIALGIQSELFSYGINETRSRIHLEKPYPKIPKVSRGKPLCADIYVDLSDMFKKKSCRHIYDIYGMKSYNWIEAKYFCSISRKVVKTNRTKNAAKIAKDIFRLCLFIQQEQQRYIQENVRYLLLIFDNKPNNYLDFENGSNSNEIGWLRKILISGRKENVQLILKEESDTFIKAFGKSFVEDDKNLAFDLELVTTCFEPTDASIQNGAYWGYLIRIVDFKISLDSDELIYDDSEDKFWSFENECKIQEDMIEKYLRSQKKT